MRDRRSDSGSEESDRVLTANTALQEKRLEQTCITFTVKMVLSKCAMSERLRGKRSVSPGVIGKQEEERRALLQSG